MRIILLAAAALLAPPAALAQSLALECGGASVVMAYVDSDFETEFQEELDECNEEPGDWNRVGFVDETDAATVSAVGAAASDDGFELRVENEIALDIESGTYDRALLFFLLHEQPEPVRRRTLAEALRVLKPGGRLVIVDYHRPRRWHPLHWPMVAVLKALEPFALDLWRAELPLHGAKRTFFGGLYQLVVVAR